MSTSMHSSTSVTIIGRSSFHWLSRYGVYKVLGTHRLTHSQSLTDGQTRMQYASGAVFQRWRRHWYCVYVKYLITARASHRMALFHSSKATDNCFVFIMLHNTQKVPFDRAFNASGPTALRNAKNINVEYSIYRHGNTITLAPAHFPRPSLEARGSRKCLESGSRTVHASRPLSRIFFKFDWLSHIFGWYPAEPNFCRSYGIWLKIRPNTTNSANKTDKLRQSNSKYKQHNKEFWSFDACTLVLHWKDLRITQYKFVGGEHT